MKKITYLIIPLIIIIFLKILFISTFWEKIEHSLQDGFFLFRGAQTISNDVVIVDIGNNTFSALDEQWPFPREYYIRLIENLEKAGAKQIIFDIELTESSNSKVDQELADVATKYDNIVFAGKLIKEVTDEFTKEQVLPPIKELQKIDVTWGTVNISLDKDGFVRRYQLMQNFDTGQIYSIGILSLATLHGDRNWRHDIIDGYRHFKIREKNIPKVTSSTTLLNYYGPAHTFRYFDFADVIDDHTFDLPHGYDLDSFEFYNQEGYFQDKIVLIGVSAEEFHDSHNTPFSSRSQKLTPGVEIHANFIEMVLSDNYLFKFASWKFLLIFTILGFLLFLLNVRVKPSFSVFINLVLIGLSLGLSYYFFAYKNVAIPIIEIPVLIIIIYICGLVFQYLKTLQERKFIKQAFTQYMAPELVEQLIKDPKKLSYGGTQKEISVLFADIRSFTPYTESHSPKETVTILQEYLTTMVAVIQKNKGTLDKFVGDAIIAIFGSPVDLDNHAYWACKAALEMREAHGKLKKKWIKEKRDVFEFGIGVNSGVATVGNLGSEQIFDYTAIGDTMNTGARIENMNKEYPTENKILVSESTYKLIENQFKAEFVDEVKLKGKAKVIGVYNLGAEHIKKMDVEEV